MSLEQRSVLSLNIAGLAEGEVWRLEGEVEEYWLFAEGEGKLVVWKRKMLGEQYAKLLGEMKPFSTHPIKVGEVLCLLDCGSNPINIVPQRIERMPLGMGDIPQAPSDGGDVQAASRLDEFTVA